MLDLAREDKRKHSTQKRLERLRASLLDRKNRVDSDLHHESGPIPANFAEQATAVENDETLVAIQGELGQQLYQVNLALRRLEAGEYGFCDDCGNAIGDARLEAIPTASLCFNCASLKS